MQVSALGLPHGQWQCFYRPPTATRQHQDQQLLVARARTPLCRCSAHDGEGPSTSSSQPQLRSGPARKPWRAPRARKAEPMLKPTSTLCWVNRQLLVLFDPKRQRLMYVLAPNGAEDAAEQQLAAVMHASQATAVFFGEHAPGHFQRLSETASGAFGVYTLCIPVPPIAGMSAFVDQEQDFEPQLPGSSRLGWLQTRIRRDPQGHGQSQANTYAQAHRIAAGRGRRRGSRGSLMSQLQALVRSRGRAWPHRRGGDCHGGPHSPAIGGWDSFVAAYREALRDGFALSPDIMLVKNQQLEDGPGEPDAHAFNLNMPLGSDPEDYTAFLRTRHETNATQQYLEQCLRAESSHVENMARLEQQWRGLPADLDQEWGGVQQANTTTGRAKQAVGSQAPGGTAGADAVPGTAAGVDGAGKARGEGADVDEQGGSGDEARSRDALQRHGAHASANVGNSSGGDSTATADSGSEQEGEDQEEGNSEAGPLSGPDLRLLAKPVRRLEDDKGPASPSPATAAGAASELAPGIVPSTRQGRRGSSKAWGVPAGSRQEEQEEEARHASPSGRDTSSSAGGSGSSSSSSSSSNSSGSSSSGGNGSSRQLNRDLEIAELLLGRKATPSDVAQLKAAFAQAQAVEAAAAGTDAATGLPMPALLLKQSLESLMVGSSRAGGLGAGPTAESASGRGGSAVVSGGRILQGRSKRRRLALPVAVHRLVSSAAFAARSSSVEDGDGAGQGPSSSVGTLSHGQLMAAVGECMQLLRPSVRPSHRYVMGRDIVLVVSSQELLQELANAWDTRERRCMLPGIA